jgi:hypothetical protein
VNPVEYVKITVAACVIQDGEMLVAFAAEPRIFSFRPTNRTMTPWSGTGILRRPFASRPAAQG